MRNIYCAKCGIRGSSKCPHCRSVFGSSPTKDEQKWAQEYFEMFMSVGLQNPEDRAKLANGEEARFTVTFWTYDTSEDTAIAAILGSLKEALQIANLTVAACIHDWQLLPGETSSIGCGHEGAPAGTIVPADPYA